MADISGNMAAALGYLDFGPSAYQKNKIMQALLQRQENMQTQMGYTGGTPAQQAAGMDYLNLPVSDRNAQSEAEAVKMSDLATAARRNEGAFTMQKNPLGQVAEKKAQVEAGSFLPTTESLKNSSNPFLMGEQAANAPLLWNPVEGKIKAAGDKKPAAGSDEPKALNISDAYNKSISSMKGLDRTIDGIKPTHRNADMVVAELEQTMKHKLSDEEKKIVSEKLVAQYTGRIPTDKGWLK